MSCPNSVTEFTVYSEITPTGTFTYCFLSYFESEILINIGSLESLVFNLSRGLKSRQGGFLPFSSSQI